MSLRTEALHPALRVVAAGCVLLWLSATSYCSLDELFDRPSDAPVHGYHAEVATANAHPGGAARAPHAHGDPADAHDGRGSRHHNDGKGVCCSHLHATVPMPESAADESASHTGVFQFVPQVVRTLVASTLGCQYCRHVTSREWVFRPEVCLGPAVRGHAPPSSPLT